MSTEKHSNPASSNPASSNPASSTVPSSNPAAPSDVAGSKRTPKVIAVVMIAAAAAFLASFTISGSEPLEESLDNATFFADQPTTTTTSTTLVTTTTEPGPLPWLRLMPEAGEGVLVATSLEQATMIEVWSSPDDEQPAAWQLAAPTEFGGLRNFLVIGEIEDWVHVKVPVRPNGSTGWVRKADVSFTVTSMRIEVDVSDRLVTVFDGDTAVFETIGAVGRDAYPTPIGEWFLRDAIPWDENSVYGPWVLALSAYSEQIDEINGGQAVVALHGTSQPDKLGSAASLGCVRLANDDIRTVASLVPVGAPVIIRA